MRSNFEKRIRPTIDAFVADLKRLTVKLVEDALRSGVQNAPQEKKPKAKPQPRKTDKKGLPTVIDCGNSVAFAQVAREIMTGPEKDWNSKDLAKKLKLGDTTVRGYLKELVKLGLVKRTETTEGRKRVSYTRTNRKVSLS